VREYVLGVDGGNTKTDYFLFKLNGVFVDWIRDATCSQEVVGYEGAERILNARIRSLLKRNGLGLGDLAAGAFGLAGIDHPHQRERLLQIIANMGIPHYEADNDGFLGVVAGTSRGIGVCSINGTGTVAGGIDPRGNRLQVGGIGPLVGDDAGGTFIAHMGVRAVYDSFFRCGEPTLMAEPVFRLLGIADKSRLMEAIGGLEHELGSTEMTRTVFSAASAGDGPALAILDQVGLQLAKTTAGCALNLRFGSAIEIVLAGSVWQKAECPALFEVYKRRMQAFLPDRGLLYHVLSVPPATGAVLWAMSLAGVDPYGADIKGEVVRAVESRASAPG
jgi:N-acetylglucosamine kinase-like BadF-type ATPase